MLINKQSWTSFLLATLFPLVLSTIAIQDCGHQKKKEEVYSREDFRLPLEVLPVSYKVHLAPFLEEATFHGRVEISTTPNADRVSSVTLHVHPNVTVKTVDVIFQGKSLPVKREPPPRTNETNDFYVIELEEPIVVQKTAEQEGRVVVVMEYSGVLGEEACGFFRSSYLNADNQTEYVATTFLEATNARMVFPCFDEPALKARFELTVSAPAGYTALSNTPQVGPPTTESSGRRVFSFQQTPPMSTYLVAAVVSKFQQTVSTSSPDHSVWSRPGTKSQREFAAKMAGRVMDALVNITGLPYQTGNITKMDNAAIPVFLQGGMENWGLVTYRQSVILADDRETPFSVKVSVASTVAHEYSHQYFGNMVSPAWWNVVWLSEGFATYHATQVIAVVEPTWRPNEHFVVRSLNYVLKTDSLGDKEAIVSAEDKILHPKVIMNLINDITYTKGAAVLIMTEHVLGTETFRAGVKNYLQKMYLKAAKEDDLFDALAESAKSLTLKLDGFSLQDYLKSWTNNPGYPLLTVTRDYEAGTAKVTQNQFLIFDTPSNPPKWITPVNWATNSKDFHDTRPTSWLRTTETLQIPATAAAGGKKKFNASSWIVVNNMRTGFYRVHYDEENWRLLNQQLLDDHSVFPPLTQVQLIDDAFALAWSGKLNYTVALDTTRYLRNQDDVIPLMVATRELRFLVDYLRSSSYHPYCKSYLSQLVDCKMTKILDAANADEESLTPDDKFFLHHAARWSLDILPHNFTQKVTQLWPADVPADLRLLVYCARIRAGDGQVWKDFWNRYLRTNVETEKDIVREALSCSSDPEINYQYLVKTTEPDSGLRKFDYENVYLNVGENSVAFDTVLKFIDEQISAGSNSEQFGHVVLTLVAKAVDQVQTQKLMALAKKMNLKIDRRVEEKEKWIKEHEESVGQWFKKHCSAMAA